MVNLPDYKLMIPGPAGNDDDVFAVMGQPTRAHYGPEWAALFQETTELMKQVFITETADVVFLFMSF